MWELLIAHWVFFTFDPFLCIQSPAEGSGAGFSRRTDFNFRCRRFSKGFSNGLFQESVISHWDSFTFAEIGPFLSEKTPFFQHLLVFVVHQHQQQNLLTRTPLPTFEIDYLWWLFATSSCSADNFFLKSEKRLLFQMNFPWFSLHFRLFDIPDTKGPL